jgi:hypothetical protein
VYNFALNYPLLITLFQIPSHSPRTSPWINIMWLRLKICTVARRGWFAPDMFPYSLGMLFLSLYNNGTSVDIHVLISNTNCGEHTR